MSQNLHNFVKFQKFQLDNLVDFEKCCKTHIFLQKSVPIQPKTNNILPKFCQKLATTPRAVARAAGRRVAADEHGRAVRAQGHPVPRPAADARANLTTILAIESLLSYINGLSDFIVNSHADRHCTM